MSKEIKESGNCVSRVMPKLTDKSCNNCDLNNTYKCIPSICAMVGTDGHGLWTPCCGVKIGGDK